MSLLSIQTEIAIFLEAVAQNNEARLRIRQNVIPKVPQAVDTKNLLMIVLRILFKFSFFFVFY